LFSLTSLSSSESLSRIPSFPTAFFASFFSPFPDFDLLLLAWYSSLSFCIVSFGADRQEDHLFYLNSFFSTLNDLHGSPDGRAEFRGMIGIDTREGVQVGFDS
jgi:hypothetical protein